MITAAAAFIAVVVAAWLTFGLPGRLRSWRATVTPLASIIGSGFLVSGPLMARDFGLLAAPAMAVLLALAYAVGAVIRFNIIHAEPLLKEGARRGLAWSGRAAQITLTLAYSVSVAFYLKLLAEFLLRRLGAFVPGDMHALTSNIIVTVIIGVIVALGASGGLRRIERAAEATVSVKLGVILALLLALALYWTTHPVITEAPPTQLRWGQIPFLLGLLIVVQGFETSRYLGLEYDAQLRVKTMRRAQWLASAIYIGFLLLLTPLLAQAARTQGVAGVLDVAEIAAPGLGVVVLIGAAASQLSAAVADSIGAAGLAAEQSGQRLSFKAGVFATAGLTLAVVWLTDPVQVIALASRFFGLYYALQCAIALIVRRRMGGNPVAFNLGVGLIALACLAAAAAGAPAES